MIFIGDDPKGSLLAVHFMVGSVSSVKSMICKQCLQHAHCMMAKLALCHTHAFKFNIGFSKLQTASLNWCPDTSPTPRTMVAIVDEIKAAGG